MFVVLILIFVSYCGVYGDVPQQIRLHGPCPDPPAVPRCHTAKFSGIWYDVLHTSRPTTLELHCDQIQFVAVNKTTMDFSSFTYNVQEEMLISVLGSIEVIKNTGNLRVKIPSLGKSGDIRILHLEYSTIALLWACKDLGDNLHEENVVVLTRNSHLSEDIMSQVDNILLENQLSTVYLDTTPQYISCKNYDFDSTIELNNYEGDSTSIAPLLFNLPPQDLPVQEKLVNLFWETLGYMLIMFLYKMAPTIFGNTLFYRIFKYSIIFTGMTMVFYNV